VGHTQKSFRSPDLHTTQTKDLELETKIQALASAPPSKTMVFNPGFGTPEGSRTILEGS